LSLIRCWKPFETAKTGHMSWAARWWEMEYKKEGKRRCGPCNVVNHTWESRARCECMIDPSFEKQTTGGGREERHVFHAFVRMISCNYKLVQWFMVWEFLIVWLLIASCDHADLFGWIFEVAVHFIIFTEYSDPHRSLSQ
jgi:hypothetical protein